MKALAVIDLSISALYIYDIGMTWNSEEIVDFIHSKGHKESQCSWGVFDGQINDERNE